MEARSPEQRQGRKDAGSATSEKTVSRASSPSNARRAERPRKRLLFPAKIRLAYPEKYLPLFFQIIQSIEYGVV